MLAGYKPVPVEAAKKIAEEFDKQQVVIIAVDHPHDQIHTATYGVSAEDKVEAASLGEHLAKQMGLDLTKSVFSEDFRRDYDAAQYKVCRQLLQDALTVMNASAVGFKTQEVIENFLKSTTPKSIPPC